MWIFFSLDASLGYKRVDLEKKPLDKRKYIINVALWFFVFVDKMISY